MQADSGKLWTTLNNGEIEIRSVTEADVEESLDILDKSFFPYESSCKGCEVNLPENVQSRMELRELCRLAAQDGVSIVAKDALTGRVVAVAFNKIQYIPEDNEDPFFVKFRKEQTHSPQAQCLMDFMIEVDGECDVFEKFNIDCVCELMFLATLPEYGRKGIAVALAQQTINLTRDLFKGSGLENLNKNLRSKRPKAVTALFSSQFSQKVGKTCGFQVLNTVPYTRFSYNGRTFQERIDPMHTGCQHVIFLF